MYNIITLTNELREKYSKPDRKTLIVRTDYILQNVLRYGAKVLDIICSVSFYDKHQAYLDPFFGKVDLNILSDECMTKMTDAVSDKAILARVNIPSTCDVSRLDDKILVLNGVSLPINVGSLIRTAVGLGVKSIICCGNTITPFSEQSLQLSGGHLFGCKIHLADNLPMTLEILRQKGYTVVSSNNSPEAISINQYDFNEKSALVVGGEKDGIDEAVLTVSDDIVKINLVPTVGALTTSSAGAILLHQMISE